ncbi:MAG: 4Fe-4S binding protein [Demequinaceae bacterium]|nr:4Fe-4S binding protein [Demequinaceae bacterium]
MHDNTVERQCLEVDIACVGFGPASGGFLTTLSRGLTEAQGEFESSAMPGLPPQVVCYERADDLGFGVSGVVTRATAIRETYPDLDSASIPMTAPVTSEKVVYLLDPIGASRRGLAVRFADAMLRGLRFVFRVRDEAFTLPFIPKFLHKDGGLVLGIGQFHQWVASQLMAEAQVQLWPGTPVAEPLIEDDAVVGVRLVDQGTDLKGEPDVGYLPGMDIKAALTVVADGPVGPIGRKLDEHFGLPEGHERRDWAVGMKLVVDLPEDCALEPGTVLHTMGYPEPEVFGFLYVNQPGLASLGIFVPSSLDSPVRASYRYLQHWMQHPYLWKHLKGGKLRSWGAKTLQESGRQGEPHLVGDGYARIGEGSGSTNILTNSGVDEAWATGAQLAEAVLELLKSKQPFTRDNLERTYVKRRRESTLDKESKVAAKARVGFRRGFVRGVIGTGLTGLTRGRLNAPGGLGTKHREIKTLAEHFKGRIPASEIERIEAEASASQRPLQDVYMDRVGWPAIPFDGELLVSHQDALLLGGKVQAPPGYADHVVFLDPAACAACETKPCIAICSGQALTLGGEDGVPLFDREKCIHCGACQWSCPAPRQPGHDAAAIALEAGAGGLHSAEN